MFEELWQYIKTAWFGYTDVIEAGAKEALGESTSSGVASPQATASSSGVAKKTVHWTKEETLSYLGILIGDIRNADYVVGGQSTIVHRAPQVLLDVVFNAMNYVANSKSTYTVKKKRTTKKRKAKKSK